MPFSDLHRVAVLVHSQTLLMVYFAHCGILCDATASFPCSCSTGHPEVDLRNMQDRDQKLLEEMTTRGENADLMQQMADLPVSAP